MSAEPIPPLRTVEQVVALLQEAPDLRHPPPELRQALIHLVSSWTPEAGRNLRLVGRAKKVSVSMPEDLTIAVQQRVGHGQFSQYVSEAVARQLEHDLLGELLEILDAEYGPVPEEMIEEAMREWPDA